MPESLREGTPEWALAYMEDAARHTLLDEGSGTKELRKAVKVIATALAEAEARGRRQGLEWRPIETAPKDGTPIWAYLYDSGIREVSWWSAEAIAEDMGGRPEEYQEGFYEGRSQDEWCARWWLPLDALPSAPDCATATAETQKPEETA